MTANEIGMLCEAVTKLGIAGKQAFFLFMAVKAFEVLVIGGVVVYAITVLFKTIRHGISSSSFCDSITRIVGHNYKFENSLSEEAKKKITDFVVETMTDKRN